MSTMKSGNVSVADSCSAIDQAVQEYAHARGIRKPLNKSNTDEWNYHDQNHMEELKKTVEEVLRTIPQADEEVRISQESLQIIQVGLNDALSRDIPEGSRFCMEAAPLGQIADALTQLFRQHDSTQGE
jgi:ribosome-binding protein aMBF1 (putative translation factor)